MWFYKDATPNGDGMAADEIQKSSDGKGTAKYSRRREVMNKRALIKKIVARLTEELQVYFRAANASRTEATHEQNKAEGKYDTRGSTFHCVDSETGNLTKEAGAIITPDCQNSLEMSPG
jgi:hypothetical protein